MDSINPIIEMYLFKMFYSHSLSALWKWICHQHLEREVPM